MMTKRQNNMPS